MYPVKRFVDMRLAHYHALLAVVTYWGCCAVFYIGIKLCSRLFDDDPTYFGRPTSPAGGEASACNGDRKVARRETHHLGFPVAAHTADAVDENDSRTALPATTW